MKEYPQEGTQMIRTGEINIVNKEAARKISKEDLIRSANNVKAGVEEPTTFNYKDEVSFSKVDIFFCPFFSSSMGKVILLFKAIFEPKSDFYFHIKTLDVLLEVGKAWQKWEQENEEAKGGMSYVFTDPDESLGEDPEFLFLRVTAVQYLDDAEIETLMDAIKPWTELIRKVSGSGLNQAVINHENMDKSISNLNFVVDSNTVH